jgi:hypothetical protein
VLRRFALEPDPAVELVLVNPDALALIANGERCAIGTRGPYAVAGRWVWCWKDRIDRRFIARYHDPR